MTTLRSHVPRRTRSRVSILFAASLLGGTMLAVTPAMAQSPGMPRNDVVRLLGEQYSEAPVALGIASNGGLIELFTSRDGATWTIMLTLPNGTSYLVTSGQFWMTAPPKIGHES